MNILGIHGCSVLDEKRSCVRGVFLSSEVKRRHSGFVGRAGSNARFEESTDFGKVVFESRIMQSVSAVMVNRSRHLEESARKSLRRQRPSVCGIERDRLAAARDGDGEVTDLPFAIGLLAEEVHGG